MDSIPWVRCASGNVYFLLLQRHCNHNRVPQQILSCSPEEAMAGISITIKTVLLVRLFQFSILREQRWYQL